MDKKGNEYAPFDKTRVHRIYALLKPHIKEAKYRVHIMGTNGKGSTGRFITQSLHEAGFSVLHFTSPHLFEYKERFFINDKDVDSKTLEKAHEFLQSFDFITEASYFEYSFFLCLVLAKGFDYLVAEAGVGGEYDATSCISYQASIYTPIDFDHKDYLGDTLESIATTKLKAMQGLTFIGKQQDIVKNIAKDIARTKDIKLVFQTSPCNEVKAYALKYHLYPFLESNLTLASLFLDSIKVPLLTKPLSLRGRLERLKENLYIDVGHNAHAARNLTSIFKDIVLIYNTYKDKDYEEILKILKPVVKEVLIYKVDNYRILDLKTLQSTLDKLDIKHGLYNGKALKSSDTYVVFGSFSLIEAFLKEYEDKK
ncbi:Mur ligase family protein [Helicobacter sp. 13S00401-1]|uniref:Mur ligase family protein n=1 Tax=Helicobacter sp. 13S00401-1 TaxID=1905758 RepID=UPI001556BD16|nr:Mur ligase family protein [Helicobacter sp. 13S00401-1]